MTDTACAKPTCDNPARVKPTCDKPAYEEVVRYCAVHGLIGKLDTVRFYDFYAAYGFRYKGKPVDWRAKAREWASKPENRPEFRTACEEKVLASLPQKRVFHMPEGPTEDVRKYLTWLSEQFRPQRGPA